jgi:hypothetical protein
VLFASRSIASAMLLAITPAAAAPLFEAEAICRAAIASITDRDPKIMQVTRAVGSIIFLTYVRPIDNFIWTYRCRIEGNRVVWADEPGRWREDNPGDDKIFFETTDAGKQLRIVNNHDDGSSKEQVFDRDEIE